MTRFQKFRAWLSYLWDMFTLFGGVSTPSGLERTQGRPVRTRGIFLFRSGKPR